MSGTVLRGDWIKLHRRDNRVWIRERPFEVVWRTTADFTVDDIRSVEIQARQLELNRRRRLAVGQASTRVRPAVTRIIFDLGTEEPLTIDVREPEVAVAAVFADLGDRLVVGPTVDIDLVAEHAAEAQRDTSETDGLPLISWRADDVDDVDGADHTPIVPSVEHPADEVDHEDDHGAHVAVAIAEPETAEDWLELATEHKPSGAPGEIEDEELFPADESLAGTDGGWVRKRRKRPIHHRVLRSSEARR